MRRSPMKRGKEAGVDKNLPKTLRDMGTAGRERGFHVWEELYEAADTIEALQQRCEELDEERLEQMIGWEGSIYDVKERDKKIAALEEAISDLIEFAIKPVRDQGERAAEAVANAVDLVPAIHGTGRQSKGG